jgi:membrane protein
MLARVRAALFENRFATATFRLVRNLDRHDAVRAANAMAFDAFLSIIPLLAMLGWAVAKLHQRGDLVLAPILRAAPGPVSALADQELLRLGDVSLAAVAPLSIAGFLWVSSGGLSTAMGVFETIFLASARPWYVRRVVAMACVVGGLLLTSLFAVVTFAVATTLGPSGAAVIGLVLPTLVLVAGLVGFMRIAVRRPAGLRRQFLPGAVVTAALWDLVSLAYAYYVSAIAKYTTFYGSLASVAILLLWLWLLAMALLVGGEVNAQLEGIRDPAWATPLPAPKKQKSAPPVTPPTSGSSDTPR